MTRQRIIDMVIQTVEELRKDYVACDKENTAFNALKYKVEGNFVVVYIDTDIAPSISYGNKPWISTKRNGKQSPNEGWWDVFANEFAQRLNTRLRGTIK